LKVPIYAALRSLGRRGLEDVIERCCRGAARMASHLHAEPGIQVLNEIVLNQVLVRCESGKGQNLTPDVIARIQRDGVCWVGGTQWQRAPAMRISVSNWRTHDNDIDRSAGSIVQAFRACRAASA
jgi:glutamate/tyrosine decarboxylase-like PLP-dependent enzyme